VSSRYIKVALPEQYATQLDALAANSGERVATLAGQLIRYGLSEAVKDGRVREPKPAPPAAHHAPGGRARWLEPYGGDPAWRAAMWGQIVALRGRFPQYLSHLKDGWWKHEAHTDALCALATWRADIDDNGTDPRDELAFLTAIIDFGNLLRQEGGGVTKAWKPGAPPNDWASPAR
jgi:hypothetical protein